MARMAEKHSGDAGETVKTEAKNEVPTITMA